MKEEKKMDNQYLDVPEEVVEPVAEEPAPVVEEAPAESDGSDVRSFDELSDDEQLDVLKSAFFDDDEKEAEDDGDEPDGETEEPKEVKKEEAPAEAAQESEAKSLYTPDEYLLLDPAEVDSSRLPEGARLVHDRNMKYFNQVIAPQLAELQQLRAFRDEALKKGNAPQQAQPEAPAKPDYASFSKAVKAEAARRLGVEEIDEFDADHNIMVSLVAGEMQRNAFAAQDRQRSEQAKFVEVQNAYNGIMSDLAQEYGDEFKVIDAWALQEMQNVPHKTFMKITEAFKSGNASEIKQIYKEFADRYHAQQKRASAPAQQRKVVELPHVIGGSRGMEESKTTWGISDFRKASRSEQQRMIAEKFFS